jgi:outer membrane protein TolC
MMRACLILLLFPLSLQAQESLGLADFLSEVQKQNLMIKAEEASAQAAQDAAVGVALPPPMIAVSKVSDQGNPGNAFEVSQTLPFPTRLANDRAARKLEARSKQAMQSARVREILAEAKLAYFKLWKAQERILVLQEKKSAVAQHIKLAQAATLQNRLNLCRASWYAPSHVPSMPLFLRVILTSLVFSIQK